MTDLQEDFLAHYGIKGMKWGSHLPGKGEDKPKRQSHLDYAEAQALRRKPVSTLSNQEIRQLTQRQELERKLKKARDEQNPILQAQKVATAFLGVLGTIGSIYGLTQSPTGKKVVVKGQKFAQTILAKLKRKGGKVALIANGLDILV